MSDRPATLEELVEDRTSGAAELARRAATILGATPRDDVPDIVEAVLRAHPSMAPLWRLATEVLTATDQGEAAARFVARLAADEAATAATAAALLPDRVLTHSYSSTVLAALRLRRPATVRCTISLPGGEGRLMADAIGPGAEVVPDEAALDADAVVVGADAVTPTAVVNKVKTRGLAEAAARTGVPIYVLAGGTKLVGEEIPVTEPFEATPLVRVTGVVTEEGLLSPAEARARALDARLHPALRLLIPRL